VKRIARVAVEETEEQWIDFAEKHSGAELEAEVKDALAKGRNAPREGRYGIPNLKVDFRVELPLSEREIVRKALDKVREEVGESLGGEEGVRNREVLLYLCQRILETDAVDAGQSKNRFWLTVSKCPAESGNEASVDRSGGIQPDAE
jgi:hypothetical protein